MILRSLGFSLLALAAFTPTAASTARATTCSSPPAKWKASRPNKSVVVNTVSVSQGAGPVLTWNGSSVTRKQLREYFQIIEALNPSPKLVLVISPSADCGEVRKLRQMIQETLRCDSGQCVEVGA